VKRCAWPGEDPLYVAYHDEEWGVPEYDPRALYEKLVLDGFQAGLAWITILRKRENFRKAFDGFDPQKIARYGKRDVARLMKNEGIVRSPAKIAAAIKGGSRSRRRNPAASRRSSGSMSTASRSSTAAGPASPRRHRRR
jgi:DNA-3-methyladenine glycosylase I